MRLAAVDSAGHLEIYNPEAELMLQAHDDAVKPAGTERAKFKWNFRVEQVGEPGPYTCSSSILLLIYIQAQSVMAKHGRSESPEDGHRRGKARARLTSPPSKEAAEDSDSVPTKDGVDGALLVWLRRKYKDSKSFRQLQTSQKKSSAQPIRKVLRWSKLIYDISELDLSKEPTAPFAAKGRPITQVLIGKLLDRRADWIREGIRLRELMLEHSNMPALQRTVQSFDNANKQFGFKSLLKLVTKVVRTKKAVLADEDDDDGEDEVPGQGDSEEDELERSLFATSARGRAGGSKHVETGNQSEDDVSDEE